MKRHLKENHVTRYDEYLGLDADGKSDYFKVAEAQRPLAAFVRSDNSGNTGKLAKEILRFNIAKQIVGVILQQLLVNYEGAGNDAVVANPVSDLFTLVGDATGEEMESRTSQYYEVT